MPLRLRSITQIQDRSTKRFLQIRAELMREFVEANTRFALQPAMAASLAQIAT
jgi:hypothetical protein